MVKRSAKLQNMVGPKMTYQISGCGVLPDLFRHFIPRNDTGDDRLTETPGQCSGRHRNNGDKSLSRSSGVREQKILIKMLTSVQKSFIKDDEQQEGKEAERKRGHL